MSSSRHVPIAYECIGSAYTDCDAFAKYVRHTQFAGTHFLCERHAKEDPNFMVNDSYESWQHIDDYVEPKIVHTQHYATSTLMRFSKQKGK